MNNLKFVGIAVLLVCLLLSLCACGGETAVETQPKETEAPVVETEAPVETEAAIPDGMVQYTVTVVDEEGNPVANAMVQLCKDSCVPAMTDANGVATFTLPEDDYKASMLAMPAGYEYAGEADTFYFEGAFELTITLKATA